MATSLAKRFESLSLRERAMVSCAILGAAIFLWDSLFMQPLRTERMALDMELSDAMAAGFVSGGADPNDPRQVNLQRAADLQTQAQALDARIKNSAIGFVPADKMVQVLNDVLDRQGRLDLISIRNLPVISLATPKDTDGTADPASVPAASATAGAADEGDEPPVGQSPYVHSIELFIAGEYADIVAYLEALEKLPYRFRWNSLELRTSGYPRNKVRIQLSTISLDSTWLGI